MHGLSRTSSCSVRILRWMTPLVLWLCAATVAHASTDGGIYAFASMPADLGDAAAGADRVHAPQPASEGRSVHLRPAQAGATGQGLERGALGWAAAFALIAPLVWRRRRSGCGTGYSRPYR